MVDKLILGGNGFEEWYSDDYAEDGESDGDASEAASSSQDEDTES